jgi:predicted transposase/invertase (TIGR01784 family)
MWRSILLVATFSSNVLSVPEQTFCRPTRDSVFKFVLNDDCIRTSFIRALSPFKTVVSSSLMASDLRPLAVDENLLNILKKEEFQSFVRSDQHLELSCALFSSLSGKEKNVSTILDPFPTIKAALATEPAALEAGKSGLSKEYSSLILCQNFFAALRKKFDLILLALLNDKKGVCDIVSRLETGEVVVVEAQVDKKDCLDKRFLAYATSLYSNQIREGQEWSKLNNVASVILIRHDVSASLGWSACEYKRHYMLTNQLGDSKGTNKWPYLQLILYCLPKVKPDEIENAEERAWLEFFKSADTFDEIPPHVPGEVAMAYERVRRSTLPIGVILGMKSEDSYLQNMEGVLMEEREEGRQEGRQEGRKEVLKTLLQACIISKECYDEQMAAISLTADATAESLPG